MIFLQELGQLSLCVDKVVKGASDFFVVENLIDIVNRLEQWHLDLNFCLERPIFGEGFASLVALLQTLLFILELTFRCFLQELGIEVLDRIKPA